MFHVYGACIGQLPVKGRTWEGAIATACVHVGRLPCVIIGGVVFCNATPKKCDFLCGYIGAKIFNRYGVDVDLQYGDSEVVWDGVGGGEGDDIGVRLHNYNIGLLICPLYIIHEISKMLDPYITSCFNSFDI